MEAYNTIISNETQRQLGNCILFIAKENPEAAQRLRERLVSSIRSLEQMPARYPFLMSRIFLPISITRCLWGIGI